MDWPKGFLLLVCVMTAACSGGKALEDFMDGRLTDQLEVHKVLGDASLGEMTTLLQAHLERGSDWYGSATNTVRLQTIVQAMAGRDGGAARVIQIFSKKMGKKPLETKARMIFHALAETNEQAVVTFIRGMDFQSPRPILSEMLALLACAPSETLYSEFKTLLQGYDVAPRLFDPAFESMPILRFHERADFARPEIKALAVKRMRDEWGVGQVRPDEHAAVTERVRFFLGARTPMLAVLFIEMMTDQVMGQDGASRAERGRAIQHLYGLVEGLKDCIEARSEDEKMMFANVMARLYRAR